MPASTVYPTATPEEQKYHIPAQPHIQTGEPVYAGFEQPMMMYPTSAYVAQETAFYPPVETNEAPTSDTNYSIFHSQEEEDSNNYFNVFGFTNGMSDQPF